MRRRDEGILEEAVFAPRQLFSLYIVTACRLDLHDHSPSYCFPLCVQFVNAKCVFALPLHQAPPFASMATWCE